MEPMPLRRRTITLRAGNVFDARKWAGENPDAQKVLARFRPRKGGVTASDAESMGIMTGNKKSGEVMERLVEAGLLERYVPKSTGRPMYRLSAKGRKVLEGEL